MRLNEYNHAVLYCSKLSKLEISIEEQKLHLKRFCKHLGIDIVGEYIDTDNVNKPQLKKLMDDVKTKRFNIVISYNFDTISKCDDVLYSLICELEKYNCELHLEDTFLYTPAPQYLFKIPRRKEQLKEPVVKKKNSGLVPRFRVHEEKNPKTKESINWVKIFDEDTIRFEENELFDNEGNYYGNSRDMIVVFKDFVGCYRRKKKQPKCKPLW